MVGTSIVLSRTSIRPTHLTLLIPTQPGTIARTGKPWSGGTGSPFIAYASNVSSSSAFARDIGRFTFTESRPSTSTFRMSRGVSRRTRASSSTAPRGTPVHSATPIAPSRHCVPEATLPISSLKNPRPLPAHSTKEMTEREGRRRRSSKPSSAGRSTPLPSTRKRHVRASRLGGVA